MRWTRKLRLRLRSLLRRDRVEDELAEELQYHLQHLIDDHIAAGASPNDARHAALRDMGGIEQRKEECRDARGLRLIEAVYRDVRYSLRQLLKYPVFTTTAVLTIALGIGPNATMATLISSVFRPLPVDDANRLVVLATTISGNPRIWQRVAYPDLQDYRSSETPFSDMAAWDLTSVSLTVDGSTDRLIATAVSGNYFSTLRLDPASGRLILPSDGELGGSQPIAVLSHSYWSRRFGASTSIVGREVRIDGRPFTVVGVAPEQFRGTFTLLSSEVYVPLELFQSRARLSNRDILAVRVIARLKTGVALDQARASIGTVANRLERDHPTTNAGRRIHVYRERFARPEPQNVSQAPVLAALFLILVGAVLLIACANVLGLFLAKGLGRGREMAIRRALGASRSDLVRLCVVEALIIAVLGACGGAIAGVTLAHSLASVAATPGFPLFLDAHFDWTTTSYVGLLMVVSTLLIGLLPALRASRVDPRSDLSEGKSSTEGRRRQLIRKGLAAAQIAGSVMLLVVCGLFIRSVQSLQSVDLGFDANRVLLASTDPGAIGYDAERARAFYQLVDTAVESLPEVESVAASVFVPFGTGNSTPYVAAEDQPPPSSTTGLLADRHLVSGDYFRTIGTPLLRGRTFSTNDTKQSPRVAVINEALAARLWPGEDPVGRRFRSNAELEAPLAVIGVVRNAPYRRGEIRGPAVPRFFVSLNQFDGVARTLHVRSRTSAAATLTSRVTEAIRRLDSAVPVYDVYTLERQISDSGAGFGPARGAAVITGVLGVLALSLAVVGTYGVLSFTVRARTREIGIRMAFGLSPSRVFRMLLRESWSIALFGVAIGLALSLAAGKVMEGFLFGVVPYDPVTLFTVVTLIGGISTLVGFLPARRASRTNPIETLRYE
ncbi:MAG TPA: ABC transporter permease [Vicinamibacterales bacterium]|nr:ABC transporter permease [Vicinamibacterales bacterium]